MLTLRIRRCFALLSVCCIWGFVSCSNGEEDIDDTLSKETTPVTFGLDAGWEYLLFDYTFNGTYLGFHSFDVKQDEQRDLKHTITVDLRRGKHKLIWLKGTRRKYAYLQNLGFYSDIEGLNFNTRDKSLFRGNEVKSLQHTIFYCEKDIEVTEYLMVEQKLSYTPITSIFEIVYTDWNTWLLKNYRFGKMSFPFVSEVGLKNNRYKIRGEPYNVTLYAYDFVHTSGYYNGHTVIRPELPIGYENTINNFTNLCPLYGLNNIQPIANVTDENGQPVQTTPLPKISLRRGYTTKLTGPLFSGSTADWKVEIIPFDYGK